MPNETPPLFMTDVYDALGDLVRASGGPKDVGLALRPHKSADDAAQWVKDCLNRNRREKFDPEEVMWLLKKGREKGCHAPIQFMCEQCGYTPPEPVNAEDELSRMLREYLEIEQRRSALQPRIEEARLKIAK